MRSKIAVFLEPMLNYLGLIPVRVDDQKKLLGPQWEDAGLAGGGPIDRLWVDLHRDHLDALEAWRRSFLVRQIVRLTTAYVVGDGIKVFSAEPQVNIFIQEFWEHAENRLDRRLSSWCDDLTRTGELYPVLFTNKVTGMSQVRVVPALQIKQVLTDKNDYEKELGYLELVPGHFEPKRWRSKYTAKIYTRRDKGWRRPEPMMLHYKINEIIGATRGEGDLGPVLPWALRYSEWLKDRVKFNRMRTRLAGVDVEVANDSDVQRKQEQYRVNPPVDGAIIVHGPGEKISYPSANIQGWDSEPDGRALRLAVAAGSNVPIHFFGEGASANRATASEMGDPTHRHYRIRQAEYMAILVDLCTQAWRRYERVHGFEPLKDLQIRAEAPDVSRTDNKNLAEAAKTIVETFVMMKTEGWIDNETATRLAFKFAGEIMDEERILQMNKMNCEL